MQRGDIINQQGHNLSVTSHPSDSTSSFNLSLSIDCNIRRPDQIGEKIGNDYVYETPQQHTKNVAALHRDDQSARKALRPEILAAFENGTITTDQATQLMKDKKFDALIDYISSVEIFELYVNSLETLSDKAKELIYHHMQSDRYNFNA